MHSFIIIFSHYNSYIRSCISFVHPFIISCPHFSHGFTHCFILSFFLVFIRLFILLSSFRCPRHTGQDGRHEPAESHPRHAAQVQHQPLPQWAAALRQDAAAPASAAQRQRHCGGALPQHVPRRQHQDECVGARDDELKLRKTSLEGDEELGDVGLSILLEYRLRFCLEGWIDDIAWLPKFHSQDSKHQDERPRLGIDLKEIVGTGR